MQKLVRPLQFFALVCFGLFVFCCLITLVAGLTMLLWTEDLQGVVYSGFVSAFIAAVVFGLLVSGTRSMLGVIREGAEHLPQAALDSVSSPVTDEKS